MQIQFVRAWRAAPIGAVRDWPDGAANVLIRRGIARENVEEAQPPPASKPQPKPKSSRGTKSGRTKRTGK